MALVALVLVLMSVAFIAMAKLFESQALQIVAGASWIITSFALNTVAAGLGLPVQRGIFGLAWAIAAYCFIDALAMYMQKRPGEADPDEDEDDEQRRYKNSLAPKRRRRPYDDL